MLGCFLKYFFTFAVDATEVLGYAAGVITRCLCRVDVRGASVLFTLCQNLPTWFSMFNYVFWNK